MEVREVAEVGKVDEVCKIGEVGVLFSKTFTGGGGGKF